jgi:hypothetical protein
MLPAGHDKDSLRKAAEKASSSTLRDRLLALATLYETKSMAAAAREHGVSITQLSSWRDLLKEGGTHAVSFKGKENYRPTPEEIEAAVQSATCEADRSLLRAAGAVFNGARTQDAATEWKVQPLTLAAFVAKVTKGDVTALVVEPVSIKVRRSARQLRAMAKHAKPGTVLVLEALARIAEGTPLRDVVTETITVDLLRKTEAQLGAGDGPNPLKAEEPSGDEALLQQLEKWPSPRREPFLMTIRWLMIQRLNQRDGFDEALASNGIPKDAFEIWFERARRRGYASVVALAAAGTPPTFDGLPKVAQVEEPRFPRNTHRQLFGLIAFSNGASIKTAATIANVPPGDFFHLVSAYNEDGFDAFERIRLGQRHAIVAGLKEWRKKHNDPFPRKVADLLIASVSDDPNFADLLAISGVESKTVEKWHRLVKDGDVSTLNSLVSPPFDPSASHTASAIRAMVPYLRTDLVRNKASALIALHEGASPLGAADVSAMEESDVLSLLEDIKNNDLAIVLGFAKFRAVAPGTTLSPSTPAAFANATEQEPAIDQQDAKAAEKAAKRAKHDKDVKSFQRKVQKSEKRFAAVVEKERLRQEEARKEKERLKAAAAVATQQRKAAAEKAQKESDKRKAAAIEERKRQVAAENARSEKAQRQAAAAVKTQERAANNAKIAAEKARLKTQKREATIQAAIAKAKLKYPPPSPSEPKVPSHARIWLRGDYNVDRIDEMLRSASPSTVVKLKTLRKAYSGDNADDIASTLRVHPAVVSNWINVFNSDGLIGLMLASKRPPN